MIKYKSFEEYIQLNYLDIINNALSKWIEENKINVNDIKKIENDYIAYRINDILVKRINFTKSKIDKVEFEVELKAEYLLIEKIQDSNFEECVSNYFIFKMYGSFRNGFKGKEKKLEKIEEEPNEKLTQGLVPIIQTDELDSYATKFLKEFCPDALKTPMKLNIENILKSKEIKVYYAPMDDNISGVTYFAEDKAIVYDEKFNTKEIIVKPGTIILSFNKFVERNEGAYRNTIIHECVHWFFHRNYFELRQCLNKELTHYVCYKSESDIDDVDIYWMEWQARSLAPRILMPKKMALQKFNEITKSIDESQERDFSKQKKLELAIKKFAQFFGVSIISARIRLKELGKMSVDGILNYIDGKYIEPFSFKPGTITKNQTFAISSARLATMLSSNLFLREKMQAEKILFINKLLVINNPKYVNSKTYKMTEYALNHVDECCLIFDVSKEGIVLSRDINQNYFLFSSKRNNQEFYSLNQEQSSKVIKLGIEGASHFETHKHLLPHEFPELLEYLFQKSNIKTFEQLSFEADISVKTIRNYISGKVKPSRINIIKLGLALRLSAPYIMYMLDSADCMMSWNNGKNTILMTVIYGYQREGLEKTYKELKKEHHEDLLELSNTYLENHNL